VKEGNMKVKSFSSGLVQGIREAIKNLDADVMSLGEVKIFQLTDTLYPRIDNTQKQFDGQAQIVRVVVYEKKRLR
jgi:hypothetical protein